MNIGQEDISKNGFESLQLLHQPVGNAFISIVLWYTLHSLQRESLPEFSSIFRLPVSNETVPSGNTGRGDLPSESTN